MKLEELNGKRIFDVNLGLDDFYDDLAECRIAVDQKLIDEVLSDEWKNVFYDLKNAEGVAAHIARNMGCYDYTLSDMEGFGSDESLVKILVWPQINWVGKATEIDPNTLRWDK